ncbi:MAG: mevalonate kinase [Candidatus Geothermarchaeota archaeon]
MLDSVIVSKAPGKVILLGEHFVVHGSLALSMAIDRFAYAYAHRSTEEKIILKLSNGQEIDVLNSEVDHIRNFFAILKREFNLPTMEIEIRLDFPISAGLGSSASIGYTLTDIAFKCRYGVAAPRNILYHYVKLMEEIVHKAPSGIDSTTVVNGGIILFKKERGIVESIKRTDLKILVVDSGERRITGDLVKKVTCYIHEVGEEAFKSIIETVNTLVLEAVKSINEMDYKRLGYLMDLNQHYLRALNVSTNTIDYIIDILHENGAFGAKLTGAGGGGCVISLVPDDKMDCIENVLRREGFAYFIVRPYI